MTRYRPLAAAAIIAAAAVALAGCSVTSSDSGGSSTPPTSSPAGSPATSSESGAASSTGSAEVSGSGTQSGGAPATTNSEPSSSSGNGQPAAPGITLSPLPAAQDLAKDTSASVSVWSYEDLKTPWIQHLIARFNAEYPNVKVDWTYVPFGDLVPKLLATASTGGGPDAIFGAPQFTAQLASAGLIGDITPYWSTFADKSQFPDAVVWTIGDGVGAVQGYVNTGGIVYNKDIVKAAGITTLPTTLQEFTDAFGKVKAAGYDAFAMGATNDATTETQVLPYFLGLGENYGTFTQSGGATVFGAISDWVSKGYLSKDATGWSINDATTNFMAGKLGFATAGPWEVPDLEKSKVNFGVIPMAGGPAGQHTVPGGEGFSVMAKAKQPQLAFELFHYGLLTAEAGKAIFDEAGQIPARKDLADQSWLTADPNIAAYVKIIGNMQNRPPYPDIITAATKFGGIVNALVGGQNTVDSATQQLLALQAGLQK